MGLEPCYAISGATTLLCLCRTGRVRIRKCLHFFPPLWVSLQLSSSSLVWVYKVLGPEKFIFEDPNQEDLHLWSSGQFSPRALFYTWTKVLIWTTTSAKIQRLNFGRPSLFSPSQIPSWWVQQVPLFSPEGETRTGASTEWPTILGVGVGHHSRLSFPTGGTMATAETSHFGAAPASGGIVCSGYSPASYPSNTVCRGLCGAEGVSVLPLLF